MQITPKFIAICALFTGASALFCSDNASAQAYARDPANVVQLSASAVVEVPQDTLTMTLATTREGSDPAALQTQLRQALEAALGPAKAAASAGGMEVRTGQFSLQPRYGREGKITGWVGSTELVLEGRDFVRIGAAAAKIQTLVISSASFGLSREARAKTEGDAQSHAIERFKAKAADIAKGFGFGGYTLREVSVNSNDQGFVVARARPMAMELKSASADSPVPMEAGKTSVMVSVSGAVLLK